MEIRKYIYTGNMPSRNSFEWYYDESKRTAFGTSEEAQYWTKKPKIGDEIEYYKSGHYNVCDSFHKKGTHPAIHE